MAKEFDINRIREHKSHLPGYQKWIKGEATRLEMENLNRNAGMPCVCASRWNWVCDFCSGVIPLDSDKAREQLREQAAKPVFLENFNSGG